MTTLASGPILSAWIGVPLGVATLLLVAAHVALLSRVDMPESRRRIRRVNAWIMLVTIPVAIYAFCVASPAAPRAFALSWMAVLGLVAIVLMLACMDMLNTLRLHRAEQREVRRGFIESLSRRAARAGAAIDPPSVGAGDTHDHT